MSKEKREFEFETLDGQKLILRAPQPFTIEALRESRNIPQPPTYTAETITGVVEVHEHTEKSISTDEEKAAWAEYVKARDAEDAEFRDRYVRTLLIEGVKDEVPDPAEWRAKFDYLKIPLPDNEFDLKIFWLKRVVLKTPEALNALVRVIMSIGLLPAEMVEAALKSFRDSLGEGGAAPDGPADGTGGVVAQQPPVRDEDGQGLGDTPQEVVQAAGKRSRKKRGRAHDGDAEGGGPDERLGAVGGAQAPAVLATAVAPASVP